VTHLSAYRAEGGVQMCTFAHLPLLYRQRGVSLFTRCRYPDISPWEVDLPGRGGAPREGVF